MGEDFNKLKMVAKIIKTFIHVKGKTLSKPDITENLVKLEMDARNEELNHIIIYCIWELICFMKTYKFDN